VLVSVPMARGMARVRNRFGSLVIALGLGLGVGLAGAPAATASWQTDCDEDSNLCVEQPSGASWAGGTKTTAKERKRRSLKGGGTLALSIEGGRGSVFVNGRYVGTAPVEGVKVPRGKSDVQVRDGAEVLAWGVLLVPKDAQVVATVRHP
jgi:hypothetical protein